MTAKELIAELQKVAPETEVRIEEPEWDYLRLTIPAAHSIEGCYICPFSGNLILTTEE